MALHVGDEETKIGGRHVGQRMRPVFEDRLVEGLGLVQMLAPVRRDARLEDMVVAALDHVDRVDLHVAQVLHGERASPRGRRRTARASSRCARNQMRLAWDSLRAWGLLGMAGHWAMASP